MQKRKLSSLYLKSKVYFSGNPRLLPYSPLTLHLTTMKSTLDFLFGKEVAAKMRLLEQLLQAVERNHARYFASIQPKLISAGQGASLVEYVQPRWQAGIPTLDIDPTLPQAIAAECLECLQQVKTLPAAPKKQRITLSALFTSLKPKAQSPADLLHEEFA